MKWVGDQGATGASVGFATSRMLSLLQRKTELDLFIDWLYDTAPDPMGYTKEKFRQKWEDYKAAGCPESPHSEAALSRD